MNRINAQDFVDGLLLGNVRDMFEDRYGDDDLAEVMVASISTGYYGERTIAATKQLIADLRQISDDLERNLANRLDI